MTDQLTPEQIQQARELAEWVQNDVHLDFELVAHDLAKVVLALTEQVETLDDEALKWTEIAGRHAEEVEALTEQQPEPVSWGELNQTLRQGKGYSLDVHFAEIVAEELLSRYTITRKPEGADHGE